MSFVNLVVSSALSRSARARQIEAMFDVPAAEAITLKWRGDVPFDERSWNVGLIVGPSGSGKSSVARALFAASYHPTLEWNAPSVIDDVDVAHAVQEVTQAFSAVGFNTIPAWLRPYTVLSTGERFRVDLARRLLELPDPIVVDEFSSVVDRRVAQIGSHAVAKFARRLDRKFVAVSCHNDIIDWLQPDWILEPATMAFRWRSLQRRPNIVVECRRTPYSRWRVFAPFHYLTAELNKATRCYGAAVDGHEVVFVGELCRPGGKGRVYGVSRVVTLPDWQGLGLAFVLMEAIGAARRAVGQELRMYPAHPSLVRSFARSPRWRCVKPPGRYLSRRSRTSTIKGKWGGRPNATFIYVGDAMVDASRARAFLDGAAC